MKPEEKNKKKQKMIWISFLPLLRGVMILPWIISALGPLVGCEDKSSDRNTIQGARSGKPDRSKSHINPKKLGKAKEAKDSATSLAETSQQHQLNPPQATSGAAPSRPILRDELWQHLTLLQLGVDRGEVPFGSSAIQSVEGTVALGGETGSLTLIMKSEGAPLLVEEEMDWARGEITGTSVASLTQSPRVRLANLGKGDLESSSPSGFGGPFAVQVIQVATPASGGEDSKKSAAAEKGATGKSEVASSPLFQYAIVRNLRAKAQFKSQGQDQGQDVVKAVADLYQREFRAIVRTKEILGGGTTAEVIVAHQALSQNELLPLKSWFSGENGSPSLLTRFTVYIAAAEKTGAPAKGSSPSTVTGAGIGSGGSASAPPLRILWGQLQGGQEGGGDGGSPLLHSRIRRIGFRGYDEAQKEMDLYLRMKRDETDVSEGSRTDYGISLKIKMIPEDLSVKTNYREIVEKMRSSVVPQQSQPPKGNEGYQDEDQSQ